MIVRLELDVACSQFFVVRLEGHGDGEHGTDHSLPGQPDLHLLGKRSKREIRKKGVDIYH